jgi:hypothetical protein
LEQAFFDRGKLVSIIGIARNEYDDSLEIGMAAGLDPATAMALAQVDDGDRQPSPGPIGGPGCTMVALVCVAVLLVIAWVISLL